MRIKTCLITTCLLLSVAGRGQEMNIPDIKPDDKIKQNEITLTNGVAVPNVIGGELYEIGYTSTLSYSRFLGMVQLSIGMTAMIAPEENYDLMPNVSVNKMFCKKKMNYYIGCTAGYIDRSYIDGFRDADDVKSNGYTFGVHGGVRLPLGNRFILSSQIGLSSFQLYETYIATVPHFSEYMGELIGTKSVEVNNQHFRLYLPCTIGIGYRF